VRDPLRDFATGISARASVSALHDDPVQTGFWIEAGEWTDIVSADGNLVVGLVWNKCNAEALVKGFRAAPTLPPAGR
jgi:hypothetical protein